MSDDDKIIPFGKYKGQEIDIVRQHDPQYLQWLTQQAWFVEKFQPIYQVVINQFAPASEDTPAHNALQVRFLEDEYRDAFWELANLVEPTEYQHLRRLFRENTKHMRQAPDACVYRKYIRQRREDDWMQRVLEQHRAEVRRRWLTWRFVRNPNPPVITYIGEPRFEGVTDVVFPVTLMIGNKTLEDLAAFRHFRLGVEIKPSMGDDYPAVLRQIKRQQAAARLDDQRPTHWFLLLDQFSASNVTLDQVRKIFAQDGITIVLTAQLP